MELSVILGFPVLLTGICSVFYAFLVFNNRRKPKDELHTSRDWNFFLKKFWARRAIRNWKKSRCEDIKYTWETDSRQTLHDNTCDNLIFYGSNKNNSSLYISFTRRGYRISEIILILTLEDGTTYQLPDHPRTSYTSASGDSWNAAGLSLTLQEAFKRWRIVFNGLLGTTNSNGQQELKHVRFNFIWIFASSPSRIPLESSDSLLAEAVAHKPWKNPFWLNAVTETHKKGYDQYGCFNGFVILDETIGPQTMGLHGFRKRRWQPDDVSLHRYMSLFGTASDGTVYIVDIELTKGMTQIKHGNMRTANGFTHPIESVDIDTELFSENSDIPKAFTVKLSTSSHNFLVFISLNKMQTMKYHGSKPEPWKSYMIPYQMGVNGYQGSGYLQLWYPSGKDYHTEPSTIGRHLSWLHLEDKNEKIPVCSSFKDRISSCPAAVGGKAASLALLSSVHSNEFCVPNGFCLTTRALQLQMNHNPQLFEVIKNIENASVNYNETNMKECCQRATSLFEKTPICDIVTIFITEYYVKLCEREKKQHPENNIFVAVRSSGIGEDSEELSAAGQNATILGCKSIQEVLIGVQKCWASLFTFQSVEYRRQYGQVVDCGMGVVVQVMVESEAAGVMFTKHPNNGNPRELLITSSYGLGESVVSGHVEPDTIIVNVDGDKLTIKSYEVGKKGQKIVLDHNGNQQTQILEMKEDEGKKHSISEEDCLALARLGLEQEALWGTPRDIEWAIVKGKIYLLQARPITCLNIWSEYELLHEQDSAVMSDEDLMTFANTGEVMPGALSVLSQSTMIELLDSSIARQVLDTKDLEIKPRCTMVNTHHHTGINIFNSFLRFPEKKVSVISKTYDIAICGHEMTDEKMLSVALHRHGAGRLNKIKSMIDVVYTLWTNKKTLERCLGFCNNFKVDLSGCATALEMYREINRRSVVLEEVASCHTATSTASAASQIVFLTTLLGTETDFTLENYQDIGTILSSCSDVVSADIPESLKNISLAIKESGKAQVFSEQKPEEAKNWLKDNIPNVYSMFMDFLEKHGHRTIKEFDVMEDTWSLDPTPILKTLQASSNVSYKGSAAPLSTDQLIAKLATPITNTAKKVLKFVIPICKLSVSRREATKAAFISATHHLRLAYRQLGNQMVKEWRLPDSKLLYMLTNSELERLLKTRDPGLLAKAKLRMRYFPKWNKMQFEEMNWGFPQPIVEDDSKILHLNGSSSSVVIHGTPVFSGDIVARACVIRDISKIDELQHGDILVTHSTDVGWTPYFPMLGGVVTELGGLISHGAVVAREYGLPCIVGAQGATNAFKTGDTVLLAAASGVLKKVDKS